MIGSMIKITTKHFLVSITTLFILSCDAFVTTTIKPSITTKKLSPPCSKPQNDEQSSSFMLCMSKSNDVFDNNSNNNEQVQDSKRRFFVTKTTTVTATAIATAITTMTGNPSASMAGAMARRSRTDGYEVQKPESEWQSMLSPVQYDVLRNGGTERPYSSILEGEERPGIYVCAGCGTPLFDSKEKFHSGTGWPSFARGISPGVEIEDVNAATLNLVGAELRCKTCGGHLGDVFADGILFVGTPAFTSGKRYCIDGAALAFVPQDGSDPVMGDKSPLPVKKSEPSWLSPPKINAK